MKKGSGNIVYELSQTLDCGATNQITLFAINAQSAQFIIKFFYEECCMNAPYGDAHV